MKGIIICLPYYFYRPSYSSDGISRVVLRPPKLTAQIHSIHTDGRAAFIWDSLKSLLGDESAVCWYHFVSNSCNLCFINVSYKSGNTTESYVLCLVVVTQEWRDIQYLPAITIINCWLLLYCHRVRYVPDKIAVSVLLSYTINCKDPYGCQGQKYNMACHGKVMAGSTSSGIFLLKYM